MHDTSSGATTAPAFPMQSTALMLHGAAGALELACDLPESNHARAGVAIVCHPHPLQGGTMFNKVVTTLGRSFVELTASGELVMHLWASLATALIGLGAGSLAGFLLGSAMALSPSTNALLSPLYNG